MNYTIRNITLPVAQRLCTELQGTWLKWLEEIWDKAGFVIGKTVYTTDSHKCPDPKEPEKKGRKAEARKLCLDYLREEIRLIQPKAIIAFGGHGRHSIEILERVKFSGGLKSMTKNKRVKIVAGRLYAVLPHPSGIWRKPPMSQDEYRKAIRFVFAKVNEFLNSLENRE